MISMTIPQLRRAECLVDGRVIRLEPREAEVIALLLAASPSRFVSSIELLEALWPNPDLEPDCAKQQVTVWIYRCRCKGVPIESGVGAGRGHVAAYRISATARAEHQERIAA